MYRQFFPISLLLLLQVADLIIFEKYIMLDKANKHVICWDLMFIENYQFYLYKLKKIGKVIKVIN